MDELLSRSMILLLAVFVFLNLTRVVVDGKLCDQISVCSFDRSQTNL